MANGSATLVRLDDTDLTLTNPEDDVRGQNVVDRDGQEVGEVDGLIVDRDQRRVRLLHGGHPGHPQADERRPLIPSTS